MHGFFTEDRPEVRLSGYDSQHFHQGFDDYGFRAQHVLRAYRNVLGRFFEHGQQEFLQGLNTTTSDGPFLAVQENNDVFRRAWDVLKDERSDIQDYLERMFDVDRIGDSWESLGYEQKVTAAFIICVLGNFGAEKQQGSFWKELPDEHRDRTRLVRFELDKINAIFLPDFIPIIALGEGPEDYGELIVKIKDFYNVTQEFDDAMDYEAREAAAAEIVGMADERPEEHPGTRDAGGLDMDILLETGDVDDLLEPQIAPDITAEQLGARAISESSKRDKLVS